MLTALLLGGLLAGGIGYFAARMTAPPPPPDQTAAVAELSDRLARELAVIDQRLSVLENRPPDSAVAGLKNDLASLSESFDAQTADLSKRLAETEAQLRETVAGIEATRKRLAEALPEGGAGLDAALRDLLDRYGADIEALKQQLTAQSAAREALAERIDSVASKADEQLNAARAKIDELSATASEAVRNVDLSQTFERLRAAVETGRAYGDLLAEIARQASIDIPAALERGAANGIPTLPQLQAEFPAAARDGLKAAIRADAGEGIGAKLGAFLKSQIGARSLEEREGNDPDAILSRAEAALKRGELAQAVALVMQLPEPGVEAMSDWLKSARARLAAESALDALNGRLNDGN